MKIKPGFLTLLALIITLTAIGQKPTCKSLHTGSFKVFAKESGTTFIKRTEKYQIEKNDDPGYEVIFDITWIDECTYELRPKKLIKGDPSIMGDGTHVLKTKIKKISDNSYIAETSANFSEEKFDFVVEIMQENLSPIFDISPDNKSIVLAITNGPISNLYIFSLTENKLTQLTDEKSYYSRPVFSPNGDKILFLSKNLEAETSGLCSIDLSTRKITKLTDGKTYVTEGAFMPNGSEIIYCGAGTITNYSPLARKAPHDIDLYSIKIDGGNSKKLTNFSAYEFSDLNPNQKGDALLCKLISKGLEGIYLVSLSDTVKTKIEAVNNPRPEIGESFYGSPAYAKDNTQISFTAPYQLYTLNLTDKKCVEVWSTLGKDDQAMPIFSRFDGATQKLFFSVLAIVNRQYSRSAQIYSYDLATRKTTQIFIPMTK